MSQWVIHRDPRWWPEPDQFRPERWLNGDSETLSPGGRGQGEGDATKSSRPTYAYFPFSSKNLQVRGWACSTWVGLLSSASFTLATDSA